MPNYYFNAPLQIPYTANLALVANSSGDTLFLNSNSSQTDNLSFTWPAAYGTDGQVLKTDGNGILYFSDDGGSGGIAGSVEAANITVSTDGDVTLATENGSANIFVDSSNSIILGNDFGTLMDLNDSNIQVYKTLIPTGEGEPALGSLSNTFNGVYLSNGSSVTWGSDNNVTLEHLLDQGLRITGNPALYLGGTGDSNISVDDVGSMTVNATANLTIEGANVIVSGPSEFDNTTTFSGAATFDNTATFSSTSTFSSTANFSGDVNVTGTGTFNGKAVMNNKIVMAIDTFTDEESGDDLWVGSNNSVNKHIFLNANGTSTFTTFGLTPDNGTLMNIFFTNNAAGSAEANIDFNTNGLYTGTGPSRYLVLNTSGQSASLLYINADGNNDGWRIINSGGLVY